MREYENVKYLKIGLYVCGGLYFLLILILAILNKDYVINFLAIKTRSFVVPTGQTIRNYLIAGLILLPGFLFFAFSELLSLLLNVAKDIEELKNTLIKKKGEKK